MNDNEDIAKRLVVAEEQGRLVSILIDKEVRCKREKLIQILRELHNNCRINLISKINLFAISSLKKNEFRDTVRLLSDTIPTLTCSHQDVLKLVSTLVKTAGNKDLAAGYLNMALANWSRYHPEEAIHIVEGIKRQEPLFLEHGFFAVLGLDDETIGFNLIESKNYQVCALGLRSLAELKTITNPSIKRAVDAACDVLSNKFNEDFRACAIEAAFRLWEKLGPTEPYRQDEFINMIGKQGNAMELSILSAMLAFHNNGLPKESVELILDWLAKTSSHSSMTLKNLDLAIENQDTHWDFERVVAVFENCIPKLQEKLENREYEGFTKWIWENPLYASYLSSRWLSSGQFDLCFFLSKILKSLSNNLCVEIRRSHLPSSDGDQIFMAQKTIGFLCDQEITTASILLSIVKNGKSSARDTAEELLFNPLLLSYSGKLRDYLESQIDTNSKRITECIKRLLKKHDLHINEINTSAGLVELIPSVERRRAAAINNHERSQEIQRQVRERSIISNILAQKNILYGRKIFYIFYDHERKKHPKFSELSDVSYSIELPRLSVIDPLGLNIMISVFRNMQRNAE